MNRVYTFAVVMTLGITLRGGVAAQCCGDCNRDGEVTVDELVTGVNRLLDGCQDDGVCPHSGGQQFPATGQTTAYGPGSDGNVAAGAVLAYRDNGDGTITDLNTGLMWEKKDEAGGIHDKDNQYTWGMTAEPHTMNGTMVTVFLAALNTAPCFAGHCDWRIPNARELQSIVNLQNGDPAVSAVFNTACAPDCSVTSCSCTQSDNHWSSTTYQLNPGGVWFVDFFDGSADADSKAAPMYVRAVRGGL